MDKTKKSACYFHAQLAKQQLCPPGLSNKILHSAALLSGTAHNRKARAQWKRHCYTF